LFKVREASEEPGDILWENMGVSLQEKCWRHTIYVIFLCSVMLFSFGVIYIGKSTINKIPAPTDCSLTFTTYNNQANNQAKALFGNISQNIDLRQINFN